MSPDEFRRHGREIVEWIADYMERVESFPVRSSVKPGEIRALLPDAPPQRGEPFEDLLADLDRVILPGITHWQHPGFMAYFPANSSGPSVLADLVSSGLGVQGMLWSTSPACTELETHMCDWLVALLGLPDAFRGNGVIQDTASSATLAAIVAARHRAGGPSPALRAYASKEAHSSVEKGMRVAGFDAGQLRLVETDPDGAMRPDELERLVVEDGTGGLKPFLVVATSGTTSSMAFDPLVRIGELAHRHHMWVHVDAAMAGSAAVAPELRFVTEGAELADSWCFNPHKWLLTNFDCDVMYVADRRPLIEALSILPEYLRNAASESGDVIDYRDWHVQLGRRFRALKLWFVLRHYGTEGLQEFVRNHVAIAQRFAGRVAQHATLDLLAPVRLNLICFAHRDGDNATQRLLDAVNADGRFFLTHTRLHGRLAVRVCIGQTHTEQRHADALWEIVAAHCG